MSDDGPESVVLRYLRKLDADVGRIRDDMAEVKMRLGHIEEQITSLHHAYASLSVRMDRFDARMYRIERRLDLRESEPA